MTYAKNEIDGGNPHILVCPPIVVNAKPKTETSHIHYDRNAMNILYVGYCVEAL